MRRLLVAGFAALAVVLGLVVTTGVASAAPSALPCAPDAAGVRPAGCDGEHRPSGPGLRGGLHVGADVDLGSSIVDPHCGRFEHSVGDQCVPNVRPIPGGPRGGWHPGLPWGGPTLYGHQLWLQANLGLDICGYGNSYDMFLNRNLSHRSDIDRYLGRNRWQSLYTSDCNSGLAVLPGGLTLVNGNLLNLDLLGLNGAGTVNVCSYPDWNTFDSRFGGRFGNRFGAVRNRFGGNAFNVYRQLRVNAHCTTVMLPSSTTVVQQPAQTLEAAPPVDPSTTGDEGVQQPLASAPLPANAPAKAPNEGGWDVSYVLAHARVA